MQKMNAPMSYDMSSDMSVDVDNSVEIGDFWRNMSCVSEIAVDK